MLLNHKIPTILLVYIKLLGQKNKLHRSIICWYTIIFINNIAICCCDTSCCLPCLLEKDVVGVWFSLVLFCSISFYILLLSSVMFLLLLLICSYFIIFVLLLNRSNHLLVMVVVVMQLLLNVDKKLHIH